MDSPPVPKDPLPKSLPHKWGGTFIYHLFIALIGSEELADAFYVGSDLSSVPGANLRWA